MTKEEILKIYTNKESYLKRIRPFLSEHRYLHSQSVANLCYQIADKNGLFKEKFYLSGLFHDLGKNCAKNVARTQMETFFRAYIDLPDYTYHQFIGSLILKSEFNIFDKELNEAILCHCTGKANMSLMDKVLYASDKIDPLRGYDSEFMIKAMLNNIEEGFKLVLKENFIYLKSKNAIFDRLSKNCYQYYKIF